MAVDDALMALVEHVSHMELTEAWGVGRWFPEDVGCGVLLRHLLLVFLTALLRMIS